MTNQPLEAVCSNRISMYPIVADKFDVLGREVRDAFPGRCKWGWGWQEKRKGKTAREAALCQECGDNGDLFEECAIVPAPVKEELA